jgi:hypothetical protein
LAWTFHLQQKTELDESLAKAVKLATLAKASPPPLPVPSAVEDIVEKDPSIDPTVGLHFQREEEVIPVIIVQKLPPTMPPEPFFVETPTLTPTPTPIPAVRFHPLCTNQSS